VIVRCSFQHNRRRRPSRVIPVGAALSFVLLLMALAGCFEHRERGLPQYASDPRAANFHETMSTLPSGDYAIRLAGKVLPGIFGVVDPIHSLLPASETQPARLVGTWWVTAGDRHRARTAIVSFPGPSDSTMIDGSFLLQPFVDPASGEQRLLTWSPTLRYVPADNMNRLSLEELFVRNYSKETLLSDSECLLTALRAASRGESLVVSNRLLIMSDSGDVRKEILLGARQKPTRARIVSLQGRETALIDFNSGYQVSELLYRELMHPRVAPGKIMSPSATDAVFGSFRGIVAVDLETGTTLWQRRMGAPPHTGIVWDLDGDGLTEIISLTNSPENGVNGSGTTDAACSYVLCLDHGGRELWRHRFTGPFLRLVGAVADLTDSPGYEVVVTRGSEKTDVTGAISIFSASGELLKESSSYGSPRGLVLADVTSDGREEIIVGGTRGSMYALDGALDLIAEFADTSHQGYKGRNVCPVAANDIDGDGETEILALSLGWTIVEWSVRIDKGDLATDPHRYIISLGEDFMEEARACVIDREEDVVGWARGPGDSRAQIDDLDGDGVDEVLIERGRLGAYVFEVVPKEATE